MFSPRNGARTTTALREIEIDLAGISQTMLRRRVLNDLFKQYPSSS
jgi:hypothetical protein